MSTDSNSLPAILPPPDENSSAIVPHSDAAPDVAAPSQSAPPAALGSDIQATNGQIK